MEFINFVGFLQQNIRSLHTAVLIETFALCTEF